MMQTTGPTFGGNRLCRIFSLGHLAAAMSSTQTIEVMTSIVLHLRWKLSWGWQNRTKVKTLNVEQLKVKLTILINCSMLPKIICRRRVQVISGSKSRNRSEDQWLTTGR